MLRGALAYYRPYLKKIYEGEYTKKDLEILEDGVNRYVKLRGGMEKIDDGTKFMIENLYTALGYLKTNYSEKEILKKFRIN